MKRVTLLIFLVAGFVPAAAAQEHGQVGVFAEYYKLKKTNTDFGGLGGRFAINYRRSVAFEAEMGYDFEQVFTESFTSGTGTVQFVRSNIRALHGLFGPKIQRSHGSTPPLLTPHGRLLHFRLPPPPPPAGALPTPPRTPLPQAPRRRAHPR